MLKIGETWKAYNSWVHGNPAASGARISKPYITMTIRKNGIYQKGLSNFEDSINYVEYRTPAEFEATNNGGGGDPIFYDYYTSTADYKVNEAKRTGDGYLTAKLIELGKESMTFTPVSANNNPALKITHVYIKRDLSNKLIGHYAGSYSNYVRGEKYGVAGANIDAVIYKVFNTHKFPAGSSCLEVRQQKASEPFFRIAPYSRNASYISEDFNKTTWNKRSAYVNKTLDGLNLRYAYLELLPPVSNNPEASYKGGYKFPAVAAVTRAQQIAEAKKFYDQRVAEYGATHQLSEIAKWEITEKESFNCTWYNTTASKAIESVDMVLD